MARPLRIQFPGAVYHVTCRGNERRAIFRDDKDRATFLDILARSLKIYEVNLFSYVLMENHFHLLLETSRGNLAEFMRHFNISYTGYFNRRHRRVGHLYQGRFKSILVDKDAYLSVLSRYIHLNPIRTRGTKDKKPAEKIHVLLAYRWSSLRGYVDKSAKERIVEYETVLGEYGGNNWNGRRAYRGRILADLAEGLEVKEQVVGQSVLGGEGFVEWVKRKFLEGRRDRERPSVKALHNYRAQGDILRAVEAEARKTFQEIARQRGQLRQIAMDLLYRLGGMKGIEIGRLFGVDYSTVSQGRKRLRERMERDKEVVGLMSRIEQRLSR